jgi:AcrR family transcriptional regulator
MRQDRLERADEVSKHLTRESVIGAALALIDMHGEDQLTMRKLADTLDVFPTAIYWHAGNRAALLAGVCERVFSEIELPSSQDVNWQEWVRSMAHAVRRTLLAHPNMVSTLSTQMQVTVSSFPFVESVLEVLDGAGFEGEDLAGAYNTVIGTVFGFVFGELTSEPSGAESGWSDSFQQQLNSVQPSENPVLARSLPYLAGNAFMLRWVPGRLHPLDKAFEYSLDVLIEGLAAKLAR